VLPPLEKVESIKSNSEFIYKSPWPFPYNERIGRVFLYIW